MTVESPDPAYAAALQLARDEYAEAKAKVAAATEDSNESRAQCIAALRVIVALSEQLGEPEADASEQLHLLLNETRRKRRTR
jgi:hypothetical protein